jgi:hypothetical protein
MADFISLVARMRAFEAGRAVRVAAQRQIMLQPHALVLSTIAMAGEDTTVHAVAVGGIGKPAQVYVVPDPRVRDEHYGLFEWLLTVVEPYFLRCRERADFPQVWVSSGAGIAHLDTLADRLRYNQHNADARRLGELLSYATERSPIAGQQALISAAGALRLHFATGQQDGEDEHLGALLTWIRPPPRQAVQSAVELAERQPMGVNTDPEFDTTHLVPRLADYNAARKRGAPAQELRDRGALITAQLSPVVEAIYAAVQRAYAELQQFSGVEAPLLGELRRIEADQFERFMQARDDGQHLPYRDKPKGAAFRIADREQMIELTETGLLRCDSVAQARAYLRGSILRGTVAAVSAERVPHRTIHRLEIRTSQATLRVRTGDELASLADGRLRYEVTGVSRRGKWSIVALEIISGMRSVGCPPEGAAVELGPLEPDWNKMYRERIQMSARLANPPWTHTDNFPIAQPRNTGRPRDLVNDVEKLR